MKITAIAAVALTILAMGIAMLVSLPGTREYSPEEEAQEPQPPPTLDELMPLGARADSDVTVRVLLDGDIVEMSMELYLIGVVAAEMPASFEHHALKAQAVAARTDALHKIYVSPKPQHPDADVCGDFRCCVAFNTDEQLRDRWGDDYIQHITRIIDAVTGTDGVFLAYNSKPILAVFHSSSAGMTETSGNVWVHDLPYLRSVDSPETSELVPGFIATVAVSRHEFVETALGNHPYAVFGYDQELWITDIAYTESGRVAHLTIGGVQIRGTELRSMFGLRSTAVSIEVTDEDIIFTTTGYGHGVGMSQYGAHIMAQNGKTYREILSAYYTGVKFIEPDRRESSPTAIFQTQQSAPT